MPDVRTAIFKRFSLLAKAFCHSGTTPRFLAKTRSLSHISPGKMAAFGRFLGHFFSAVLFVQVVKDKIRPLMNNCTN
jgi:hypothetical protein